jgi:hypothetical protein
MDSKDMVGSVLPIGNDPEPVEEKAEAGLEALVKKLTEGDEVERSAGLSDLLAALKPQEGAGEEGVETGTEAKRSTAGLADLLKMPELSNTIIKLLAEKLGIPASTLKSLVGAAKKAKKKTKKAAAAKTTKKKTAAKASKKTTKKSAVAAKKSAKKKATTKKSSSAAKKTTTSTKTKKKPAVKKTTVKKKSK